MPRFRTSLWDVHGYVQETWLDRVNDTQIDRELNSQRSFSFTIPINDVVYPLLQTRKIVRLHDTDKEVVSMVTGTGNGGSDISNKCISVSGNSTSKKIEVGDYIHVYDNPPNAFTGISSSSLASGTNVSINLSSNSGSFPSKGDFLKISEEVGKEKIHSTGVSYRSSNSEVIEVLGVSSPSITVDLAYNYDSGAIVSTPGRSFVARVLGLSGDLVYLNRMDFEPAVGSLVNTVNFETFRINEISESRDDGIPMASIDCRHITFDLNDFLFFKDARMDVSYSSGGSGLRPDNVVTPSVLLDAILARHTKKNGTPVSTKSFIRGDLVQFYYSKGQVSSYTSGQSTITGTDLADWANIKFSPGSLIYIDGLSAPLKINSQNGGTLTLSSQSSSTISNADYYIASSGIYAPDISSSTGTDSEVLTPVIGTATFSTSTPNKLTSLSFASTHLVTGKIKTGAVVRFEQRPDEEYYVSYVDNGADVYLTENLPLDNGTFKLTVEPDEREVNVSSMDTSLGVLNNLVNKFSDDKQQYYYWITEDRAINIYRRPESDVSNDRDPTSDLVVMYRNDQNRNLRSISREFDYSDFGNRIIPQGANSGWTNVSSGIKVGMQDRSITGTIGTFSGYSVSWNGSTNRLTDEYRNEDFETLGVSPGMRVTMFRSQTGGANPLGLLTESSYVVSVSGNYVELQDEPILVQQDGTGTASFNDGGAPNTGGPFIADTYEIDFGVSREQYKIPYRDNKFFRLGDPVLVHQNKQEFTISDATQVTITKSLVNSVATSGTGTNSLVDTSQSFSSGTHDNTIVHKFNSSRPFLVDSVTNSTTLSLTPNSSNISSGDNYKISSTKQYVLSKASSTVSDISAASFRDGGGSSVFLNTGDYLYFGSNEKFDYVQYNIINSSSVTAGTAIVDWSYWDGSGWAKIKDFDKNPDPSDSSSENFFGGQLNNHQVRWVPPRRWTLFSSVDTLNINAYWVRLEVTKAGFSGTNPSISDVRCYGWEENKYRGGMLYIETGKAKGQSRKILSNDLDTLVIGNRFPNISDVKGATAIISEKVGQTHVRGFGYRVFSVKLNSATDNTVTVESLIPEHAYYNGLLTVKTGAGQGQVFRIIKNEKVLNETKFTIDGIFNPKPDGQIEVFAHSQMFHSDDSVQCRESIASVAEIANFSGVNWTTDMWSGGIAVITDSVNGNYEIRSISGNGVDYVSLDETDNSTASGITNWVGSPTVPFNAGCILMKEHSLYMNVVSGLDFTPNHNDDISLELKMGGGPLTVGKSVNYRTYANFSTRDILNVEDASFFSKGDIVFIGAQEVPTSDYYNVNRGDQVLGHIATVKRVINIKDRTVTSGNNSDINDTGSSPSINFETLGVSKGMMVKNTTTNNYAMVYSASSQEITTSSHKQDPTGSNPTLPVFTAGQTYSIQSLVLEDDLEAVPQFGDHVELVGFTDGTSARKNDLIETKFSKSDTTDPTVLYRESKKRLQKLKDIEPRYSVSFVDLYELDPEKYPFDNYALGDTIKIIDEDITGIDGYNLRIIKESFDPALPEDKTHTIEVGKRKRTFLRDDYIPLNLEVSNIRDSVEEIKTTAQAPICAYFDSTTKQCIKQSPPNSFCGINESNNDGRLTRRKTPITKYHCQSFTPINNHKMMGVDGSRVDAKKIDFFNVDSVTFPSDISGATLPIDVDFVLDENLTSVHLLQAVNSAAPSGASTTVAQVDVRILKDSSGDIIPYNQYNSEFGYGGYVQARKTVAAPTDPLSYNVTVIVVGIGRYDL
ncbi:MAG TPA: hypothetical protein DGM69_07350 [Chloroflexi bacterium]|nr:hypothetical protein [Chloroflexota bacterium]